METGILIIIATLAGFIVGNLTASLVFYLLKKWL